jgi:AcrR family transcriptional regulator
MRLSRARIISAAMDLIERDGPGAVSMNGLATELGCSILSLFSVVPSRAALLDGVADAITAELGFTPVPDAPWQDQVRAHARILRQLARTRPHCTLVAVSRPASAATRARPVECAFATLLAAGFVGDDAARIARALVAYAVGAPLTEAGTEETGRRQRRWAGQFPAVLELHDPDGDFEFGLDLIVRASTDLLAQRA